MAITPFLFQCNFNSSHSLLQSSCLRPLRSLFGLLLLYAHQQPTVVLPASGGAMGGSHFSSHDSSYLFSSSPYSSYGSCSPRTSSQAPKKAAYEVKPIPSRDLIMFLLLLLFLGLLFFFMCHVGLDSAQMSVVKLQVGSFATGRSLLRELNRIAESTNTSTKKGWIIVLQETIQSLLRHSHDCISGYSSVDVKSSIVELEKHFNQLCSEERGKFDELTLVNVNNRKKSTSSSSPNGLPNEYIVVTIIVAARGVPELPTIETSAQLEKTLHILASIPSSNIMGVEVLWTPQKEDDSLTEERMCKDYPNLRPL